LSLIVVGSRKVIRWWEDNQINVV